MMHFSTLSIQELTILSTILALEIGEGATPDELNIIGNFLVSVGSSLLVMAAQEQYLQSIFQSNSDESSPINPGVPTPPCQ